MTDRIHQFLADRRPQTPCLVIDLAVIEENYRELERRLPLARIYYAVKANPAPEIIGKLAELGSCFDIASRGEIDLCLAAGVPGERLSFGNTIKKQADIAYAFEQGVR
ncbi:MAG: ornithine decarboxylase, partial [Burkholderiales bacterium]